MNNQMLKVNVPVNPDILKSIINVSDVIQKVVIHVQIQLFVNIVHKLETSIQNLLILKHAPVKQISNQLVKVMNVCLVIILLPDA